MWFLVAEKCSALDDGLGAIFVVLYISLARDPCTSFPTSFKEHTRLDCISLDPFAWCTRAKLYTPLEIVRRKKNKRMRWNIKVPDWHWNKRGVTLFLES